MDMNVYVDENLANRLEPFDFWNGSDKVLEDMKSYSEIASSGVTVSEIDDYTLFIGQCLNYLVTRMGYYCLEHFDDYLSIVQDENLREGFKSAFMFVNEKIDIDRLINEKTE